MEIPHKFIVIEGNIGSGKTSFCKKLAKQYDCNLILEQFADNPFLPFFYENAARYAFSVELFFMTERHKQLQESFANQDLFKQFLVADYFFIKTLLFAKNNLSDEEYRLFQRLFFILNANFPKPDLLLYLHRTSDDLLKNIKKRGRTYEKNIKADYLTQIQQAYFDYFKTEQDIPIIILDVTGCNFLGDEDCFQYLIHSLQQKYSKGVHFLSFKAHLHLTDFLKLVRCKCEKK